jgi:transposase
MTQGMTTPAPTPDWTMGPPMVQDWAARDRLPGTLLVDSGYVDADFLGTAQQHQSDVGGPPLGAYSGQHQSEHGYDLPAFVFDWDTQPASCPQGPPSVKWTPGHDVAGDPVCRSRFARATCRAWPTRQMCPTAKDAPRQLTVRPQAHHNAMQAARQRQETPACKAQYALRSGVERSLSQGIRRFELRQSRSRGLARTHLQQLLNATAVNIVRVIAWRKGESFGERRRQPGPFARLAPHPLSRQTVLC